MTGGSLEESREALAIAETDGLYFVVIFYSYIVVYVNIFIVYVYCILKVGFSVLLEFTRRDARL